jgi:hypothetical protein
MIQPGAPRDPKPASSPRRCQICPSPPKYLLLDHHLMSQYPPGQMICAFGANGLGGLVQLRRLMWSVHCVMYFYVTQLNVSVSLIFMHILPINLCFSKKICTLVVIQKYVPPVEQRVWPFKGYEGQWYWCNQHMQSAHIC